MSAPELLLEAADQMDSNADAAEPGRWKTWAMSVLADPKDASNLDDSIFVATPVSPSTASRRPHTGNVDHIASWDPATAKAVAAWLRSVDERHSAIEWHEEVDGELHPDKPLPPFCRACTDEEYVTAIDFGDIIDQDSPVVGWPCVDVEAARAVASTYLKRAS